MRLFEVIKKPITTEKSSRNELNSTYVLEVSDDATKIDIKKAFLDIYGLQVVSVNIMSTREKFKQWKKKVVTRKRSFKKAYVALKDGSPKPDFAIIK